MLVFLQSFLICAPKNAPKTNAIVASLVTAKGSKKNPVLPGLERLPAYNAYGMEARPLLAHHVVSRRHGTVPSSTDWDYFSFSSWFASLQSRIGTRPAPQK